MAKSNAALLIDEYIEKLSPFSKEVCEVLRECTLNTNVLLKEELKWRVPVYSNKKLLFGFAGFKNHVSITFFNGVELSDKHNLFTKDCYAKLTRTIKLTKGSELDKNKIIAYMNEAISFENSSVKKVEKKESIEIPELLKNALKSNKKASENFNNMAYTFRKEYAKHISEAKRESTKLRRLEKVIFNLEKNIKMHEHYKC